MSFEFRMNPNLREEVNKAVQDTLERLRSSDLEMTSWMHAVFVCDGSVVEVTFVMNGEQAGERFSFTRAEAVDLGQRIMETGTWHEFPISGVPLEALANFGQRLRDYGQNGC